MKRIAFSVILIFSGLVIAFAGDDTILTRSNLPIVVIQTSGDKKIRSGKITAHMSIIQNPSGRENLVTDTFYNYEGKIRIATRGSSSRRAEKKSYNVQTVNEDGLAHPVSILGMPEESEWVLYAPYYDKSLIRNALAYELSRAMGRYASRTVFTELILNGDYRGVYAFEEKIKCSPNRVDICTASEISTSEDSLTGGYLMQIDRPSDFHSIEFAARIPRIIAGIIRTKLTGGKTIHTASPRPPKKNRLISAFVPPRSTWQNIQFQFQDPSAKELQASQIGYLNDHMFRAEMALNSDSFQNPEAGYRTFFDVPSAIDFLLCNELSRNVDAYRLSTFFYKNPHSRGGKIMMGPVWDFNLAFGNSKYCNAGSESGWAYDFNEVCPADAWLVPFWWDRFLLDPLFRSELETRWHELRQNTLSTARIMASVDSMSMLLDAAQQRNFRRWKVLGKYLRPNKYVGSTYAEEIDYLRQWITARLEWMDENISTEPREDFIRTGNRQ